MTPKEREDRKKILLEIRAEFYRKTVHQFGTWINDEIQECDIVRNTGPGTDPIL